MNGGLRVWAGSGSSEPIRVPVYTPLPIEDLEIIIRQTQGPPRQPRVGGLGTVQVEKGLVVGNHLETAASHVMMKLGQPINQSQQFPVRTPVTRFNRVAGLGGVRYGVVFTIWPELFKHCAHRAAAEVRVQNVRAVRGRHHQHGGAAQPPFKLIKSLLLNITPFPGLIFLQQL